jgi:hypothetical protein
MVKYPKTRHLGVYSEDKMSWRINLARAITSKENYQLLKQIEEREREILDKLPVVITQDIQTKNQSDIFPLCTEVDKSRLCYFLANESGIVCDILGTERHLWTEKGLYAVMREKINSSMFLRPIENERPSIEIREADMAYFVLHATMCHEVVHFYQYALSRAPDYEWDFKPLMEGHARGVERIRAGQLASRGERRFLAKTQERTCKDISDFIEIIVPEFAKEKPDEFKLPDGHWGTAAFLVLEQKFGRGVYKEMIHSDKPYEMLVEMLGGKR